MKTLQRWYHLFLSFFTARYVLQDRLTKQEAHNLRLQILNNNYRKSCARHAKRLTAANILIALLKERSHLDPLSKPVEQAIKDWMEA